MIPIFKPNLGDEEITQIKESFESFWIGLGPKTKSFESDFKNYIGSRNAISVNSCTSAIHLALVASQIKKGDEVLISSMTFASTGHCVLMVNAIPILVDVNRDTLQIDISDLKKKITHKTKAIIPVHYGGHPCDMDEIIELAKENNLIIIEDAANATGAEYKRKKIGNLDTDFTCFSFEAKKNMTTGDGGMITTNKDDEIINKILKLRWVGMDKDTLKRFTDSDKPWEYDITELGFKYNMNDISAGIGIEQLKKLDEMNNKRRKRAKQYDEAFKKISWIKIQTEKNYVRNVYWLYIIRIEGKDRDKFMRYMLDNKIYCNTNFKPLHYLTYYKKYYEKKEININCPVAEEEWKKLVVLPLFPEIKDSEIDYVIKTVLNF